MVRQIKLGLIGLGDTAKYYARLFQKHFKKFELVAACGQSQTELLYAKNELGLAYIFRNTYDLTNNHDVDTVIICDDPSHNPDHVIKSIEMGNHVFVIGPLSYSSLESSLVKAVLKSRPSQINMTFLPHRFDPLLQKIKVRIASLDIQAIRIEHQVNDALAAWTEEALQKTLPVSLDLIAWILGVQITGVQANYMEDQHKIASILDFASAYNAFHQVQFGADQHRLLCFIESSDGQFSFHWDLDTCRLLHQDLTQESTSKENINFDPRYLQLLEFAHTITTKENYCGSLLDYIETMQVVHHLFQSGEQNNSIVEVKPD